MSDYWITNLIAGAVAGLFAVFSYLLKSYFDKIQESIEAQTKEIAKLEGKMDLLAREIKEGTIESATLRTEIKALWRFVDNANQRASDRRSA